MFKYDSKIYSCSKYSPDLYLNLELASIFRRSILNIAFRLETLITK